MNRSAEPPAAAGRELAPVAHVARNTQEADCVQVEYRAWPRMVALAHIIASQAGMLRTPSRGAEDIALTAMRLRSRQANLADRRVTVGRQDRRRRARHVAVPPVRR